ncbi:HupE/UreJ family protein [Caenimonas aquaedulcis]|uniref:HupE/UreJ family protein n=1 Tax=Caenimonas aquaedulcis TaxID=2793270 RepID=A0A931H1I2_9BURK|nr:HupE/UreJ family protein [Caenimonas aquaedulcis]MBG9386847.1 HupE/UreJ family protein [Caenimonas aquaedulcis]
MKRWLLFIASMVVLMPAWAHKPSDSYLTVRAEEERVLIRWDIALRDLDYVLQLDRDGNGELTWGEVKQRGNDITRYAIDHLAITGGNAACVPAASGDMQLDHHSDGTYAVLTLAAPCPHLRSGLKLNYSLLFDVDPTHRGLVQWIAPGSASAQPLVFSTDSAEQGLQLQAPSAGETLKQYVVEGVWHIWMGYDHILFLLSLLLPAVLIRMAGRWEPAPSLKKSLLEVLKVVTAFTLAHSITLSLAVLGFISLPSRFVESTIAASIIVAALNNLRGSIEKRRWVMAFVFGLIHGFGFASALADLGLPQGALALALVGFNLGVEAGQMAIVVCFVPLAFWLRGTKFYLRGVMPVGSVLIAIVALYWFIQRAFDFQGPF